MQTQSMQTQSTYPIALYVLMAAVLIQGLSGIAGGYGLMADPSGASLQIPLEWLEGSPFPDYRIPGIVLFFVLGLAPLVVFFGLWRRAYWGWLGALLLGIALLIWIGVEIVVIGYQPQPPLQLIYGILGVIILVLSLLPQVRSNFVAGP